ncbi:hypothetical protein BO71DRAFT_326423 [Aspergillus ellipticus CBS 707.79]|uniref:Zn(2)-C6 fungal-type domain-containing protein n=1 Tax=Aspergillus ellipticus CBS 707.79 TaxID=1448320 RepID=A0A319DA15_9EURO|nr:hypothetical protein BO71DRAFT_326423 [Aspergillus ellipticus CBS 707.79]
MASLDDLTNTFVLSTASSDAVLHEVPKAIDDPSRQRRAHHKSRTGCENCKRRRVRCSKSTPCASCIRRGERCHRPGNNGPIPPAPDQVLPTSKPTDATVNLLHLKLFHHFQTSTCDTLVFPQETWTRVLPLCFEFEFLMNALLCVSARHLAFLNPQNTSYPTSAATHLGRALSQFRSELAQKPTATNADAFIATSVLLQIEVWASTDSVHSSNGVISDRIFPFSSSLKQVFLANVPFLSRQPSVLLPLLARNPADNLVASARVSEETDLQFRNHFGYHRPINNNMLNLPCITRDQQQQPPPQSPEINELHPPGYDSAITRLSLLLSFLPETRHTESVTTDSPSPSHLLSDIARSIFTFPVQCHGPFAVLVERNDPHALLLLYHFYRAVGVLLSGSRYWWALKRAAVLEGGLGGVVGKLD